MLKDIDARQYGAHGRRFLIFTHDFMIAKDILEVLVQWRIELMIIGHSKVYRQIKSQVPHMLSSFRFRVLGNSDSDLLYADVKAFNPDYIFTLYYYKKLPERLFRCAQRLAVNFHPALLPKYKGAAPFTLPIENNDPQWGITVHQLTTRFDEGAILHRESAEVTPLETENSIILRSRSLMLRTLKKFLGKLESDHIHPAPNPQGFEDAPSRRYRDFWLDPGWSVARFDRIVRSRVIGAAPVLNMEIPSDGHTRRLKSMAFREVIICEEHQIPSDVDTRVAGRLYFLKEGVFLVCVDGVIEITILNHPVYGTVSARRFMSLDHIQPGSAFNCTSPEQEPYNKAIAGKKADWYYESSYEMFHYF